MGKYGHSFNPAGILRTDLQPENRYSRDGGAGVRLTISLIAYVSWGELKHEEGMRDAILELKSLTIGHRMGGNPAANPKSQVL